MRPEFPSLDLGKFSTLAPIEKQKHIIKFALFAPSAHNAQPWLFDLSENSIKISLNSRRDLRVSDPTGREAYVGIGALLETIKVVSEYFGLNAETNFLPNDRIIAEIKFSESDPKPELKKTVEAIFTRHNNRFPFEPQNSPNAQFLESIKNLAKDSEIKLDVVTDKSQLEKITSIVGSALEKALDDHDFRHELSNWVKPSLQKYQDGMPGYSLGMPLPVSMIFPKILKKFKLGKVQRKMEEKNLRSSPAFVVLSAASDSKKFWLLAGMLLQKIWLQAELSNLKIGVMAAAIEMGEHYKDLQHILKISERPLVFFRLGYSKKIPKLSPRLPHHHLIQSNG